MPKYSIAFIAPGETSPLVHRIIESPDQESALKSFFDENITEFYTNDEQGFFYFKEDFFDTTNSTGSVIQLE
ncbi:MAG: hypothetical protein L0Y76_04745 [Ignavibacteria bacterium]|nr:hypothetical protein [Ignavibacteria bacterium]